MVLRLPGRSTPAEHAVYGDKDARQARKARNIGIAWTVIAYIGALSLGWIGIAIFGPAGLDDPEFVMLKHC
ncbi:MAG: hypothetical protein R2744_09410 [Bacteroidales bacterium]